MTETLLPPDAAPSPRFFTWRKLVYFLLAIAGAVLVSVWFPAEKTVRFAWRVAPDNHSSIRLRLSDGCRLSACYLRVPTPLPALETPLVFDCSGENVTVGDLTKLSRASVKAEPGTENLALALPTADKKGFILRQKSVPAAFGKKQCELVLEVAGPEEQVRDWAKIASLESPRSDGKISGSAKAE